MVVRGKQVRQICDVLDALVTPGGATIHQLMVKLGVTRRSVERILSSMQEMEFPIYDERLEGEKEKRWKLEASYAIKLPNTTIPDLRISYHDMLCLYLLDREDPVFKGTHVELRLKSVFNKLSHFFPDEFTTALNRMRTLRVARPLARKHYADHQETITLVSGAILHQEAVDIRYHKYQDDSRDALTIYPLHLFEEEGGLYLIAEKEKTGDIRTYAVERIQSLKPTGHEYDYPKRFDYDAYLSRTFGIVDDGKISVTVRISRNQARYAAERTWAKDQTLKTKPDGSVEISFTTRGVRDVKKWVLGWGAEAEVVEPGWFREEVQDEVDKMLRVYG